MIPRPALITRDITHCTTLSHLSIHNQWCLPPRIIHNHNNRVLLAFWSSSKLLFKCDILPDGPLLMSGDDDDVGDDGDSLLHLESWLFNQKTLNKSFLHQHWEFFTSTQTITSAFHSLSSHIKDVPIYLCFSDILCCVECYQLLTRESATNISFNFPTQLRRRDVHPDVFQRMLIRIK